MRFLVGKRGRYGMTYYVEDPNAPLVPTRKPQPRKTGKPRGRPRALSPTKTEHVRALARWLLGSNPRRYKSINALARDVHADAVKAGIEVGIDSVRRIIKDIFPQK